MGFNYRKERKKFEEQMEENEKKYRAAGMSDEQIALMREYEEEQFRHERVYGLHIVSEQEVPGTFERACTEDSYWQDLDSALESLSPGITERLTARDKEVLELLCAGLNHRETAMAIGVSQQAVSHRLKKIKKILRKGL